jgi:hypothetical protein
MVPDGNVLGNGRRDEHGNHFAEYAELFSAKYCAHDGMQGGVGKPID